jgi:hypothetical protein
MKRPLLFLLLFVSAVCLFAQPPGSGTALNFDGQNDYVNITNTPALNPTTGITVEAWIKADSWGPNHWSNSIVNKEGWAFGSQGYTLRCGQNGSLSFNVGGQSAWHQALSSPGVMSTNEWYHVAGTFDGVTIRVYVNGVQVGSSNYFGSIAVGNYDVRIGQLAYAPGGNRLFDGEIDEVRIWNQGLSAATLRGWMCQKVDNSHPNYANLVGYWNMDDGTGNTLTGSGGTTINGNLTNGPTWGTSGAAIGDESVFKYGAMIPLGLAHASGDSLSIDTIVGAPAGIHLFRVDQAPNANTPPAGSNLIDSTRYWGVFAVGGTSPAFNVKYYYAGNPMTVSACGLGMAGRNGNAAMSWTDLGATDISASSLLSINNTSPGEFILSTQSLAVNISAQGPLAFCQGDSVTLNGAISPTTTYQWKLNGVDIPGANDSILTVDAPGAYSLQASDQGCSETSSPLSVVVNALPIVQFDTLAPICLNATPLLLTAGGPAGGTYSGPGINNGFFDPTVADTGFHSLSYIFTDGNGCTDSAQRSIEVLTPPSVSLDTLDGLCEGEAAIQLSGGIPLGGTYGGVGVNNNQFDPVVSGAGTFTIDYTITGANGCTNTASQPIDVFTAPMINAGPDKTTCPGNSVTLVASGGTTYIWSSGDSTQSTTVFPAGDSTFLVTGFDANGCSNTDEAKITILPAPVADAGQDQTICEGDTAFLMASGGTMYLWGNGQNTANIEVKPNDTTSYEVIVTDLSGCTDKDTVTVNVDPLPVADATFSYMNGFEVNFTNSSSNATSYFWEFGDGTSDTTANPTHTYMFVGTFEVKLYATNDCGTDTFSVLLMTNSVDKSLTGPEVSVYPNPAVSYLQVDISKVGHKPFEMSILDVKGRTLWRKEINPLNNEFSHQLDLESMAEGMYFLEVKGDDYRVVEKFILRR